MYHEYYNTFLLPGLPFCPDYLLPLNRAWKEWGFQSVDHTSSLLLLLHTLPFFTMESSTSDSPQWSSPLWVLSMGCNPSGMDCSSMGPSRSLFHHGLLSQRVLMGVCFSIASPWTDCLFRHIHQLCCGVFCGLDVDICSPWTTRIFRTACFTMIFTLSYRVTSAPTTGTAPSPPSSLTLGFADSYSLVFCSSFFCFLNMLSQSHCFHCWLAQFWPAEALFPLPLQSSWYQKLATQAQYICSLEEVLILPCFPIPEVILFLSTPHS